MEKLKTISIFILIAFCLMQSCFITNQQYKLKELLDYIELEENSTSSFTHILGNVVFDTVYQNKYIPYHEIDTLYLTDTITDTITDTLILTDTVYLPNEISIKDTTFEKIVNNQTLSNHLYIQLSGYQTSIDSLCLTTTIKQHATRNKWFERITPSIGIGVGFNGKIGVFAGIGYRLLR